MNDLQIFNNEEFGEVRTAVVNDEPMFCLIDICKALEIKNATDVAKRLDEDERTRLNLGRQGETNFITESGLYAVILRSDKPNASRFKKLGRVRYGDCTYTWYSQRVLPGGGLNIPGRHLNEHGLVVDENEYVVIASDDLPHGTVVDTPVGIQGIVYDEGSGNGNLDIYCDW